MSQVVSLEIESIAAGGDGVARTSGLVVFVPRTAPGELVTAIVTERGVARQPLGRSLARLLAGTERVRERGAERKAEPRKQRRR